MCRLSQHKQGRLVEHFVAGTTARTAARLCGVHRNTAAYYFLRLCEIIAYELEAESEAMFGGEIEGDESYFGGKRKGKRGRGAAGKIPVFGLSLPDRGLFANHEKVKKGRESLYQDHSGCFRRHADPHRRAQGGPASR